MAVNVVLYSEGVKHLDFGYNVQFWKHITVKMKENIILPNVGT